MEKIENKPKVEKKPGLIAYGCRLVLDSLAMVLQAVAGLIKEVRPNFVFAVVVLTLILFQAMKWVMLGEPLLIKDPESGTAYINAVAASVLALATLIIGAIAAGMNSIMNPPPPPTLTENAMLQIMDRFAKAVMRQIDSQTQAAAQTAAKEIAKERKSEKRKKN